MRLLILSLVAASMFAPALTHAMSKKPPKNQQVGGTDRPAILVVATPVPESEECRAAKTYTSERRIEAANTRNSYALRPTSTYTGLEIKFYGCLETAALNAFTVAEQGVCAGNVSAAGMRTQLADDNKLCEARRASNKLAIASGLKEVVQPVAVAPVKETVIAPFVPAVQYLDRRPSSARGAQSVR